MGLRRLVQPQNYRAKNVKLGIDKLGSMVYYMQVGTRAANMEQYRSGHNGHDWKSCVPHKGTEGSNPYCSARIKTPEIERFPVFSAFMAQLTGINVKYQ